MNLTDESRVWLYQSQRPLTPVEQEAILQEMKAFIGQWAAHGTPLVGEAKILDDYVLFLGVNESISGASGCSIDASVRFMKTLEQKYDLRLFDRLNVLKLENNTKQVVHYSELTQYPNAEFYNLTVATYGEFKSKGKILVKEYFG